MDVLRQFEEVLKEYASFRELMIEGCAIAENHPEGEMLFGMAVSLDQAMDELKREVPTALEGYKQTAAEMQADIEGTQQEIAKAEQGLEKLQQEAEAPLAPPPTPAPEWELATLDSRLNQYRSELLDLLKDGKKAVAEQGSGRDFREIWEDWSQSHGE